MLEIPLEFTSNIEVFVAHAGPKISYTFKPLGKEFFIQAHPLLFEQGIDHIAIKVETWNNIPCFFKSSSDSLLPYDIFSAAFYLMTRYEEEQVHLKDTMGRYTHKQSLASKNDFLTTPVIDFWVSTLYRSLKDYFPNLPEIKTKKPAWQPLFDIAIPYRYKHHSAFAIMTDFFYALSHFQILKLLKQIFVLLRLLKDPYDNYETLEVLARKYSIKPHFFVLYADNTLYESTVSIHNYAYQTLIKGLSDFAKVSLLLSYNAKKSTTFLNKDKNNLKGLTHRLIHSVRAHQGMVAIGKSYNRLVEAEIQSDYTMGYPETIGFRAGTSTPYYYYDLTNELQLPLMVYPVVASSAALRKLTAENAFATLRDMYQKLPLASATFCVAFTNEILNEASYNRLWRNEFINYLKWHAATK